MKDYLQAPVLFSIPSYEYLGKQIAAGLAAPCGEMEYRLFPDGERYLRIQSEVRGQDVVLVGGTIDERSTLDIFDMACGFVTAGCRSLTLVIPFYGYATMERAVKPGEIVTAKNRARLLSALPVAPYGNQVVMLDLHSEGIPFYFEGAARTYHLYGKPIILEEARRLGGEDFIIASVDAGRAKWVESLANDLGVPAAFVYKRRFESGKTTVSGVNIAVSKKKVIIYDDLIRSGNSLINAARAYKESGAEHVYAIVTHGVFTDSALQRLRESGLFEEFICTDSHPNALKQEARGFFKIVSTDFLFSRFLEGTKVALH